MTGWWHCLIWNGNLCVPSIVGKKKKKKSFGDRLNPSTPFHALSTPEWSHSKQEELRVKQHEDLTSQSQREEVWIRYSTLTQETSIRGRMALPTLSLSCKQMWWTGMQTGASYNRISKPFIYSGYFQVKPTLTAWSLHPP